MGGVVDGKEGAEALVGVRQVVVGEDYGRDTRRRRGLEGVFLCLGRQHPFTLTLSRIKGEREQSPGAMKPRKADMGAFLSARHVSPHPSPLPKEREHEMASSHVIEQRALYGGGGWQVK